MIIMELAPSPDRVDPLPEPSSTAAPLSKRAQKKILKREKWLAERPQRRAEEKAKRKAKLEARKRDNPDSRDDVTYSQSRKKLKEIKMADSSCRVGVVVDMSFGHLMHQRDLGKCCKQLLHCYSMNRRLAHPMQFYVTSLKGASLDEMKRHHGFENWDAHIHEEDYEAVLPRDKIVYLSSESENVIDNLSPDHYYVIGGLVDHNHHKGLCHRLAVEKGLKHARLPIDEFIDIKTRKVLTVDHVFKILTSVTEGHSWKEAFMSVLPSRKGAVEKAEGEEQENEPQAKSSE
ncbi:hypothetical protein TCAL_02301 [Tigriopus californicus]|uniref:tRNA (guanine(9)-N(1))-methyltransferase n=1 Tax=Tigriopus californicus TaxID=6832 RepID=A0A553NQ69_TIGCA|nr:tRNA methyltransferase 10 homolog A-like [Tigriopus californicus]TRY67560.1 hypothetical protein TCAL_02301 [Tigriopus californicus]